MGKKEAFARFGATLKNQRWSWSSVAGDGTVVLALWKHEFDDWKARPLIYNAYGRGNLDWIDDLGNKDRIEHIKQAIDTRNGEFRVVIVHAKKQNVRPLEAEDHHPQERLHMRITDFNQETGEFRAMSVS